MKIAIIGATGHIAKNLIVRLAKTDDLFLYARCVGRLNEFLAAAGLGSDSIRVSELRSFEALHEQVDGVVNCVGYGTPDKLRLASIDLFRVTEWHDDLVIAYLQHHAETVYVNFSSGAVYGGALERPAGKESELRLHLSTIGASDAYRICKLNSEAKHRVLSGIPIVDLRLFNFFSRFIDLSSSYLVADLVRAVLTGTGFRTDRTDIMRDFVHPDDLCRLVRLCVARRGHNGPVDVYSKAPIRKSALVKLFVERYGVSVEYADDQDYQSPTGIKDAYYSTDHTAGHLFGYIPRCSSEESVAAEADVLLSSSLRSGLGAYGVGPIGGSG